MRRSVISWLENKCFVSRLTNHKKVGPVAANSDTTVGSILAVVESIFRNGVEGF